MSDQSYEQIVFSFFRNASTGSGPSETGSLDRAKAALDRRKKAEESGPCGRVEVTRVNPDSLIDELLRTTNLTQSDESSQSKLSKPHIKPLGVII